MAIDPATDRILTEVQVGSAPGDIAVGGGSVWVLNANDQTISQINPHIRQVVNTFAAGSSPVRLAYGDGSRWVGSNAGLPLLNPDLASVARVNPSTSALPADVIKLPVAVLNAAFQFGNDAPWASKLVATSRAVWVASSDGSVYRIGPSSGRIVATIRDLPSGLLAPGRTGVWAVGADEHRGYLSLISARTNHVIARITVPATNITRPVNGDGALWFSGNYSPGADGLTWGSGGQQLLWRVRRGAIKRNFLNLGPGATSIAYGTGSVWVTNVVANTVIRVNPATLHVVHVIALPGSPSDVAVAGGLVWASVTLVGSPSRRPTPTPGNSCDGYGEVGLLRCP